MDTTEILDTETEQTSRVKFNKINKEFEKEISNLDRSIKQYFSSKLVIVNKKDFDSNTIEKAQGQLLGSVKSGHIKESKGKTKIENCEKALRSKIIENGTIGNIEADEIVRRIKNKIFTKLYKDYPSLKELD